MCVMCQYGLSSTSTFLEHYGAAAGGPQAAAPANIGATGGQDIDGLLSGMKWSGTLTYSFPDSSSDYPAGYGYGEPLATGYAQVSAMQQQAVRTIMPQAAGFTNLTIQFAGTNGADIRIAQSAEANPTAYAYYPGSNEGGDVWFGTQYDYRKPVLGTYEYLTHIHEIGHTLGLKHAHEAEGVANVAVPTAHDALEYTVMSYRSYVGGPTSGYTNEAYGFPTTFMMNDIRALQEMYGADFTTRSGNTVYSWNPQTGEFSIDGVGQGRPGGSNGGAASNVVFMTVWDGGGNDTYDFSRYASALTVDLNPGSYSITATGQLAYLGNGQYAHGNVYNAYLFNGDARSYIENAIGGSGGDTLVGNAVGNRLDGRVGADILTGGGGDDIFVFGASYGADTITDFVAGTGPLDEIDLSQLTGFDSLEDVLAVAAQSGASTVLSFGAGLTLTLQNVSRSSLTAGDFNFSPVATEGAGDVERNGTNRKDKLTGTAGSETMRGLGGNDNLRGLDDNDRLFGDAGNDRLDGGTGADRLEGGGGKDVLTGGADSDTFVYRRGSGKDRVTDFQDGIDNIDLSSTGLTFGNFSIYQKGAGVIVQLSKSDQLTLNGVSLAQIGADDFLFV
jgi:Ca2+-binding RTX toxin-like protein